MNKEAMNKGRLVHYGLFSALFKFLENKDGYDNIVKTISLLAENPIEENYKNAFLGMQEFLKDRGFEALKEENGDIFYSPTSSFIPVTASYYDERRDDGKKHILMADYVLKSKFRRDSSICKEHEDHIEFILLFMQKLIEEELNGNKNAEILSRDVFENILNPMVDEFCENLYMHEKSKFYKNLAISLRVFMEVEREVLNVVKPTKKEFKENIQQPLTKEKQPEQKRVQKNMEEINSFVE